MNTRMQAADRMWNHTRHITHIRLSMAEERSYNQNALIEEMSKLAQTLTVKELEAVTRAIERAYALGKGEEE